MPNVLVLNPAPKRRRKTAKRKTAARRRVVRAANPAPRRVRRRRANPITVAGIRRRARRHLGAVRRRITRRRRNPISLRGFSASNIMGMLKGAAVGGVGAVAMDYAWDKLSGYLPASMQITPGSVGIGEAVKIGATVLLGRVASKATKGLSEKAATGSLVVQMYQITQALAAKYAPTMLPNASTSNAAIAGMGYATPNMTSRGTNRLNFRPMGRPVSMNAFTRSGTGTPMLSAFTAPGSGSPMLGNSRMAQRQTVRR